MTKSDDPQKQDNDLDALRTRIVELEQAKAKSDTQVIELRKLQLAAETARKRSESAYRNLIDEVGSIILRCEPDGTIRFCNRFTLSFFGFKRENLLGKNVVGTLLPQQNSNGQSNMDLFERIAAKPDNFLTHETENLLRNGQRVWISWSIRVVCNEYGNAEEIICVGNDITNRKQQEDELKRLNQSLSEHTEELTRANQELNAFTRTVAHDLRRPLTSISGFTQLLEHETRPDYVQQYIHRILNACSTMNDMIQRFLDFARAPQAPLEITDVDLTSIAQKLLLDFQVQEPERQVHAFIQPEMIVKGDEDLLRQLMQNLLENAWKYSSKNTATRIEVATTSDKTGKTVYYVRDNGAGFDMTHVGQLFKPFSRLHEHASFEGTGIGLATVARIVERHSGKIWVEAKQGEGATFFFSL